MPMQFLLFNVLSFEYSDGDECRIFIGADQICSITD